MNGGINNSDQLRLSDNRLFSINPIQDLRTNSFNIISGGNTDTLHGIYAI